MNYTYVDIAFLVLFAIVMVRGFFRGFVKEAISVLGLFFAYFGGAYAVSRISNPHYVAIFHNEEAGKIIVFIIAFIAIVIVFSIISIMLTKVLHTLKLGFCNETGGFFLPELKPLYF